MTTTAQNFFPAPVFEIPDPPEELGQDGGKFYRCYDALADEIDEDMVKGLKEQLDGMLIFAGLFAGVNSAFLALTLPLLSPNPAEDTNALLAQNNAILIQLVTGRNDSVPINPQLPSANFSASSNIFAVNALFALSLAFAIVSSFLAVLGRQWLVYYRKRGGGGPDRQRWEQLKRFLGAERWRLEPILDDGLHLLINGRAEESTEALQIIALQRAICTSEDPATLLHATANILGITSVVQMEQLWSDHGFQERFLEQFRNSYSRILQLRGRDQVDIAMASRRLYSAAAAHIILYTNIPWNPLNVFIRAVDTLGEVSMLIPDRQIPDSPTSLIRGTLAFTILQFYTYTPTNEAVRTLCNHLVTCSNRRENADRRDSRGVFEMFAASLEILTTPESTNLPNLSLLLNNILHCVAQIISPINGQEQFNMEHKFSLLEICERIIQGPQLSMAASELVRRIRVNLATTWQQECAVLATKRQ
ncbi:hypothetical protein FRC00_002935 [Tulasnella sp. 408]|nr:hypothetical protein FRC00_002935 [Tulasnella sp. 408]